VPHFSAEKWHMITRLLPVGRVRRGTTGVIPAELDHIFLNRDLPHSRKNL